MSDNLHATAKGVEEGRKAWRSDDEEKDGAIESDTRGGDLASGLSADMKELEDGGGEKGFEQG